MTENELRKLSRDCARCALLGEVDAARELLQAGADPNMLVNAGSGSSETTALIEAARCLDVGMVKLMLEFGGDLGIEADGSPPLGWALKQSGSHEFCVWMARLPQHLAVAEALDMPPLVEAAGRAGYADLLQDLLSPPYRCGLWREQSFHDALRVSIQSGRADIYRALVATNAPLTVKARDGSQESALIWAVSTGNLEGLRVVLQAGEDPNLRDGGSTALIQAVASAQEDMARELLAAGADPAVTLDAKPYPSPFVEGAGRSVLEIGFDRGAVGCVRLLMDEGHVPMPGQAMLDAELVRAVKAGREDTVRLLLRWGADHTQKVGRRSLLQVAGKAAGVKRLLRAQRLGQDLREAMGEDGEGEVPRASASMEMRPL